MSWLYLSSHSVRSRGGVNAAVLTFDIAGSTDFSAIDQDYGDRITSASTGNFSYGIAEGFTTNVVVSYGNSDPSFWSTGYGNLTNVLFEDTDNIGILTITFTADPDFEVRLHSFDLAAFGGSDLTIALVDVSGSGGSLFSASNATISASTFTPFAFGTPLQSDQVTITINATNLGSLNDNIGIDNITFSQVDIPEPFSHLLFGLGVLGLAVAIRRMNQQRS